MGTTTTTPPTTTPTTTTPSTTPTTTTTSPTFTTTTTLPTFTTTTTPLTTTTITSGDADETPCKFFLSDVATDCSEGEIVDSEELCKLASVDTTDSAGVETTATYKKSHGWNGWGGGCFVDTRKKESQGLVYWNSATTGKDWTTFQKPICKGCMRLV